jgi:hypothetical protein
MLFATTLGEHCFNLMLAMFLLLFFAFKILTVLDDDGEIKKKANEGIAAWITRWLK